jgi:UDP-3-O-[3-hydroxymyristoyl] glucosamine N-acyltransferase
VKIPLKEIAEMVAGRIEGNPDTIISGIATIEDANPGDLTFLSNPKYAPFIEKTKASAIICSPETQAFGKTLLVVDNPYLTFATLVGLFFPPKKESGTVDKRAILGANVHLGSGVTIYPFVYVGNHCVIDDNVTIYPFCYLGEGVTVGAGSLLHPHVTIRETCRIGKRVIVHSGSVIGSDGFGFAKDTNRYIKIPQLGSVQIDDDVEIGACNTIDRAAIDRTWIKRGTKTDNLVQIAHNVVVGEDSLIVAQVGISGSTQLGNRVTMAGQSATTGHLKIGDDVIIGARGAAIADIAAGQVVSGAPAMPHKTWLKATRIFQNLPEMRKKVLALEKTVSDLEDRLSQLSSEANDTDK